MPSSAQPCRCPDAELFRIDNGIVLFADAGRLGSVALGLVVFAVLAFGNVLAQRSERRADGTLTLRGLGVLRPERSLIPLLYMSSVIKVAANADGAWAWVDAPKVMMMRRFRVFVPWSQVGDVLVGPASVVIKDQAGRGFRFSSFRPHQARQMCDVLDHLGIPYTRRRTWTLFASITLRPSPR